MCSQYLCTDNGYWRGIIIIFIDMKVQKPNVRTRELRTFKLVIISRKQMSLISTTTFEIFLAALIPGTIVSSLAGLSGYTLYNYNKKFWIKIKILESGMVLDHVSGPEGEPNVLLCKVVAYLPTRAKPDTLHPGIIPIPTQLADILHNYFKMSWFGQDYCKFSITPFKVG